jgi:hypothetical protein
MASRISAVTALTVLVLSTARVAAVELPTPPVSVVALTGDRVKVGQSFLLNPDCSAGGQVKARLIDQPKNGAVEIVDEKGFINPGKDSPLSKCSDKSSDVTAYYYQSKDGFKGKDRFVIETFYGNGNYRKHIYNVDVR